MPYTPMELADAFLKTGEIQDALDALNQELSERPDNETARRLRIQILISLAGETHLLQAISDFTRIAAPLAEDYQRLSILQEKLGAIPDAITAISKAREIAPKDERLTERYLDLLLAQKAYQSALNLVREQNSVWRWLEHEGDILVLLGDDTTATARYGLVLAQLAAFEGVMRPDYLQALKARVLLARAHAYRRLGQADIAQELYQAAQTLLPKDPTIAFNLGLLETLRGDKAAAIIQCQQALDSASSGLKDEMLNSLDDEELKAALLKSG
jgi:tetratricopeptide (TPR) repeat protein